MYVRFTYKVLYNTEIGIKQLKRKEINVNESMHRLVLSFFLKISTVSNANDVHNLGPTTLKAQSPFVFNLD